MKKNNAPFSKNPRKVSKLIFCDGTIINTNDSSYQNLLYLCAAKYFQGEPHYLEKYYSSKIIQKNKKYYVVTPSSTYEVQFE